MFNALIPEQSLALFPEARSCKGKVVRIQGKVQLYKKGMPEIVLERSEQLTSAPAATPPEGVDLLARSPANLQTEVPSPADSLTPAMDYDSPPRPIRVTRPRYPQEVAKRIQGTVVVEILIDSQGRVVRARVIQSVPLLDAAALETVSHWTLRPATKGGKPVPTIAHAPVVFRIYSRVEQREQRRVESRE